MTIRKKIFKILFFDVIMLNSAYFRLINNTKIMMNKPGVFLLLMYGFVFSGCVNDIDTYQVDDFKAEPVYTLDVFHMRLGGSDFYTVQNSMLQEIRDTLPMNVFFNNLIKNGFQKIEFYVNIKNELPASFSYTVNFLHDQTGIHSITGQIPLGSVQSPALKEDIFEITVQDVPQLTETNQLEIVLERMDSNNIQNEQGVLEVKSKADVYYIYE